MILQRYRYKEDTAKKCWIKKLYNTYGIQSIDIQSVGGVAIVLLGNNNRLILNLKQGGIESRDGVLYLNGYLESDQSTKGYKLAHEEEWQIDYEII